MLDHFQFNNHSEVYARRFASIYRSLRAIYDPSDALAQEPDVEEKVLRNARLAHALNFRWAQIAGRKWTCAAPEEGDEADALLAKIVMQGMSNIRRFTNARKMLARADFSGARFAEVRKATIVATYGDGKPRNWVVPVVIKDIPKERFRWVRAKTERASVNLEVFDIDAMDWKPVPAGAPLIRHVYDDSEETLGYGRGLREALYFVWYAISHIHRERIDAVERFGQGRLVLKLATSKDARVDSTNDAVRDRALTIMAKMKSRHEFVIGEGDELVQLDGSMTGHEMMSAITKELEDAGIQLILGSISTTGGGGGDGLNGKKSLVEQESMDLLMQVGGDALEESITEGIAVPFVRDNYANLRDMGLDRAQHPKFTILRGGHGDPLQNAQRIQAAQAAGLKIKRSEAYDLVELTEPGDDDDVLEAPNANPMGGPGGMPPGMGGPGGEQPPGDPNDPSAGQPPPEADGGGQDEPGVNPFAEFDESKHPRAYDGRFGDKPGDHDGHATTRGDMKSAEGDAGARHINSVMRDGPITLRRTKERETPMGSRLYSEYRVRKHEDRDHLEHRISTGPLVVERRFVKDGVADEWRTMGHASTPHEAAAEALGESGENAYEHPQVTRASAHFHGKAETARALDAALKKSVRLKQDYQDKFDAELKAARLATAIQRLRETPPTPLTPKQQAKVDEIKTRLRGEYEAEKASLDATIERLEGDKRMFDKPPADWHPVGGAPVDHDAPPPPDGDEHPDDGSLESLHHQQGKILDALDAHGDPKSREFADMMSKSGALARQIADHPDTKAARIKAANDKDAAYRSAAIEHGRVSDARVKTLPVFQTRNGWHIVKDDLEYVVRHPTTGEEAYRGNTLRRAREVSDESGPLDSLAEFDESKHRRGQPGNAGQFGPGGGGGTATLERPKTAAKPVAKPAPADAPNADDAAPKPKKAPPGSQLPAEQLKALRDLGVTKLPPIEATDVVVNTEGPDIHDRAVAKWRDVKGRVQSAYTAQFHAKNARQKWDRVMKWAPKREAIVAGLRKTVASGKHGTPEHAGALAALVIARTGLRPGGAASGEDDHFGVTTLKGPHVKVDGHRVTFDYIGKAGKRNVATMDDADAAAAIQRYKADAGDNGPLFPEGTLNAARGALPSGMKLKDFRTIKATELAQHWFASFDGPPPPLTGDPKKDAKRAAKALASASDVVAHALNNTRSVARASYIHPNVFEAWAKKVGLKGGPHGA